jgi:hypothetical protein
MSSRKNPDYIKIWKAVNNALEACVVYFVLRVALIDIYFIECNKTIYMYKEKSQGLGHYVH